MIIIAGLVIGAIWGGLTARRRQGGRFDVAQYAAVFAIIGAVIGMFATLLLDRLL